MPTLSRYGCNQGTCHGNQNGKGGLKLSLRGQHPQRDYAVLAREFGARRINRMSPADSLFLLKPVGSVPHQGGTRFTTDSAAYALLKRWIAAGLPRDAADGPRLQELIVTPKRKTIYAPDHQVALSVIAVMSDGTKCDVTHLAVFEPSSLFVTISPTGIAASDRPGTSSVSVRFLHLQQSVRLEFVPLRKNFHWDAPPPANFVDEQIFATLQRTKTNPSSVCDDSAFVRRAFLDLTGLLPPADRAREFVQSKNPDKRSALIEQLLNSPEFNDFQALRWADLLRVEEKVLDKKGVTVFHAWIRDSFAQRKPLNQFAAELIAARGSTYDNPPANFYRALRKPSTRGEAAAQVFLGIRLQCAKCHNHPFDRWTQEDYYGWANYFAKIDYKIVENKRRDKNDKHEFSGEQIVLIKADKKDVVNPENGRSAGLRLPGTASVAQQTNEGDRLQQLALWLGSTENRRFARTQVNRIWAQLMGRGIVEPTDDFRTTNPPTHPQLLERLTDELIAHSFDVRHIVRVIAGSQTYQLSSATNDTNTGDETGFSYSVPRRLTAEQTLDGIAQVLGVPAEFDGHEAGTRAVQLPGVRGGHRYSKSALGDQFLNLFGKPGRLQTCDCERTNATTLAQTFEMVSGDLINQMVADPRSIFARADAAQKSDEDMIRTLYWAALSRAPTAAELTAARAYVADHKTSQTGLQDIAWALLNSNEFLLRR